MSTLTPPLNTRNGKRGSMLSTMRTNVQALIRDNHDADLHRHDRLSSHTNPVFRAQRRAIHRRTQEIGHRFLTLKAKIEALDLSASADWTKFQALPEWPGYAPFDLTKPLSEAYTGWSQLPTTPAGPTAQDLVEWAFETTSHDIHDAFEAEVHALIGSDIHFLGTTIITLTQANITKLQALRRRRDAMLALTTFPVDPYDPNLWGHDTRLRSLTLTPKQGSGVTITPAFSAGTRAYTMPLRGDQVLRADAVTEDSTASVVVTLETNRVVVRVTSELGDVADYIVSGNAEAKLTSLSFGPSPGNNYPYTPAFDSDTLAYVTTAPLAGILNVSGATSTSGAKVTWTKDGTGVDVVVTAADGTTTRTYRITSSHSG